MSYRSTALLFLGFALISLGMSQGNITPTDKVEISYKAELMVQEFESLLNVISNRHITLAETEFIINNSFSNSSNQLFVDPTAIIEDDIDPEHTATSPPLDIPVRQYLKDLDIFYSKSDEPSIQFSNFQTSSVLKKDYLFVRVLFDSKFSNEHRELKKRYIVNKRVAEIRAIKIHNQWDTKIVSVTFFDPREEFEANEYKLEPQDPIGSSVLTATPKTEAGRVPNGSSTEPSIANPYRKEIQMNVEKYNAQRSMAYQSFIAKGDQLMENEEYSEALKAYEEALKINRYQVYPRVRIRQINQKMGISELGEYSQRGRPFQRNRRYANGFDTNRKDSLNYPVVDSLQQRIQEYKNTRPIIRRPLRP